MKRIFAIWLLITSILFNSVNVCALGISAVSAVVIDQESGRILFEKNAHQKMSMASTTKIMTGLLAVEKGNFSDIVKTSPRAAHIEGSSIWLEENESIAMEDLVYGLMLNSGNDAATAIAEHIAGSEEKFVEMMNQKAKEIGLKNTGFKNPHGLDAEGHHTTAYELAKLTSYALKNPKFSEIVKTKEKKIPWEGHEWDRLLKNHNKLLWRYQYCDGVKTGFTKKSGRCLVSSATKDNTKLVAVTLKAGDDWNDHISMYEHVFSSFKPKIIVNNNQYLKTVLVKDGKKDSVSLVAANKLTIPLMEDEIDKVRFEYKVPDYIEAPVSKYNNVGKVDIYLDNTFIDSVTLTPVEYIEKQASSISFNKILKNWLLIFNRESSPIL